MNLVEAMDGPVMWLWRDAAVAMPVWTLDELKTLLARLQAQKIAELRQACVEVKLSAVEQAYVLARARWQGLGPADAVAYFRTLPGVEEALRHALSKGGISEEQIKAMLEATPFSVLAKMAQEVVRLEPPGEQFAPPAEAGSGQPGGNGVSPFGVPAGAD